MSELESIAKLREFSRWFPGIYATENVGGEGTSHIIHNYPPVEGMGSVGDDIRGIADEIEAEISERFMELPVDADGVPIRVGDKVTWDGGKSAAKFTIDTFAFDMEHGEWDVKDSHYMNIFPAHRCRHVKPRTLEDVLREFTDEVIEWSGYSGPVSGDKTWGGMAAKYVDEIRELMEAEE